MAYRDDREAHQRYHDLLNETCIANPCNARWDDMPGNDAVRHCRECDRDVYNLSAMKAEAAVRLLSEREGRRCLRLFRRHDGTVLTTDCPQGAKRRRVRRAVTASTVGVLTTAFVTALQPESGGIRDAPTVMRAQPLEQRPRAGPTPHVPPDPEAGTWTLGW